MQQEFDTIGGVLDLPQTRYGGEVHGLAEEPYGPRADARMVGEQRERYPLLCFLAQVIVSMVRHEMPEPRKRSTRFIIDSLQNLTVTYVHDRKQATRHIYSNFEPPTHVFSGT